MPALQTSYPEDLAVGYAGQISNIEPNNIISREVQVASIAFGAPVVLGTDEHGVQPPVDVTNVPVGVAIRTVHNADAANPDTYPVEMTAPILTRGVVWVTTSAQVTIAAIGDPVYIDLTAGADFGKVTPVSTNNLLIPNATFESTGAADALVKIRLKEV